MVKRRVARYLVAVFCVGAATLIALPVYPAAADLPVLLLLAAVAISASFGGYGPAIVAVVGGFLSLAFFFGFPPYPFQVSALCPSLPPLSLLLFPLPPRPLHPPLPPS